MTRTPKLQSKQVSYEPELIMTSSGQNSPINIDTEL